MQIRIGSHPIGDDLPPYFIAEMSGNHNRSLDTALGIVEAAARAGAHAIKLQTFTPATLTLDSYRPEFHVPQEGSPWRGRRLWELYSEAFTPWEWHSPVFARARALGLDCISTAFDDSSVRFVTGLGVDAIKIASFELVNVPLIEAAARPGIPLVISTGMGSADEIGEAVAAARAAANDKLILLKCTSAYPAVAKDANLRTLSDLRRRHGTLVGLSDHTLASSTVVAAVALGACAIEKHLTIARSSGGPDAAFSLEPAEFEAMVTAANEAYDALGAVRYGPLPAESASTWERPSIFAVRPIGAGEPLTRDNIRIIRPGGGLPPRVYPALLGRRARVDIEEATALRADMVEGDLK